MNKTTLANDAVMIMLANGYHSVRCDCGNTLRIWPNTNTKPDERVRCKKCDSDKEYTIKYEATLTTRERNN